MDVAEFHCFLDRGLVEHRGFLAHCPVRNLANHYTLLHYDAVEYMADLGFDDR